MSNNLEEQLISFKATRLAKEKGFDNSIYIDYFYTKPRSKIFVYKIRTLIKNYYHKPNNTFSTYENALEFGLYKVLTIISNKNEWNKI